MSKKIITLALTIAIMITAAAVAEQVFTMQAPEEATKVQQYFDEKGYEYLTYSPKSGIPMGAVKATINFTKAPMTKVYSPEEMVAWRERDPEGFAKWAAENAEEYDNWLKAHPEYVEK